MLLAWAIIFAGVALVISSLQYVGRYGKLASLFAVLAWVVLSWATYSSPKPWRKKRFIKLASDHLLHVKWHDYCTGTVKVALRFAAVRSVDLEFRRQYKLRAQIYPDVGRLWGRSLKQEPMPCVLNKPLERNSGNDDALCTRTFIFDAHGQNKELGESAEFQADVRKQSCGLCIRVDLLADLEPKMRSQPLELCDFKTVSTRVLFLHGALQDLHEVYQVVFEDAKRTCVVDLEIQADGKLPNRVGDGSISSNTIRKWPSFPGGCRVRETQNDGDVAESEDDENWRARQALARDVRRSWPLDDILDQDRIKECHMPSVVVEDLTSIREAGGAWPVLFEKAYSLAVNPALHNCHVKGSNNNHLIVLVPDHDGQPTKMQLIQRHLSIAIPNAQFLLASNFSQEKDCEDFRKAGVRLAHNVDQFMKSCGKKVKSTKISFVAHGTGGLVVRAALPWLKDYISQFSVFVSLSTPHLGMWPPNLAKAQRLLFCGWSLWRPSKYLDQLAMADGRHLVNSFLYGLSLEPGFGLFQKILLVSSRQDWYALPESARVQSRSTRPGVMQQVVNALQHWQTARHIKEIFYAGENTGAKMAQNMLRGVKRGKIVRVDVDFEHSLVPNIFKKSAHYELVENRSFVRTFIRAYCDLFK